MATLLRNYAEAHADMLIAAATIMDSAIINKDFLQSKRHVWKDPFFQDLQKDIDNAIKKYLGVDDAKGLRSSTSLVLQNMRRATTLLAETKVQIEEDFKAEPEKRAEILRQLGFFDNFKQARNGNQEIMLKVLAQFAANIDGEMQKTIIEKGVAIDSVKELVELADKLQYTEIKQEGQKTNRLAITEEGICAFNHIYDNIISICKIAAKFYKDDALLKKQFTFSKIIATQSLKPSKTKATDTTAKE